MPCRNISLLNSTFRNHKGWLNGTINFRSDELGKVVDGEFTGEDGFNASIIFSYNQEGLLSEVCWQFSYGKFQQYLFEYERTNSP